jgi:hypothetical protein
MGIDQPKVSALLNGRLANFSCERLIRLLTALGHDVEIAVSAKPRSCSHGRTRVVEADARAPGFAEEARRQSLALARSRRVAAARVLDAISGHGDRDGA